MGRKKLSSYCKIEDNKQRTVTYNKRKRGLIKKAMEFSTLCSQEVLMVFYNKVNNKLVMYQSSPEFSPTQVNTLLG
jgi:hypothetical protein